MWGIGPGVNGGAVTAVKKSSRLLFLKEKIKRRSAVATAVSLVYWETGTYRRRMGTTFAGWPETRPSTCTAQRSSAAADSAA
jgi:hypothetical protein